MKQDEDRFSEQGSLALIESMINTAKNHFSENGHLYLLWGWVVFFCSLIHFVLLKLNVENHYMVWMFTWVAVLYQTIYLSRKKRRERVRTYADHIVGYVWLTFVITMFLMGFILARGQAENYYKLINPVFLALYGIPTFMSGIVLRFKPLVIGGVCCWVLSVIGTFMPYDYQLLLLSAAMVIAWIIPGYQLQVKYKKQMHNNG